jgi:hypothetical protein
VLKRHDAAGREVADLGLAVRLPVEHVRGLVGAQRPPCPYEAAHDVVEAGVDHQPLRVVGRAALARCYEACAYPVIAIFKISNKFFLSLFSVLFLLSSPSLLNSDGEEKEREEKKEKKTNHTACAPYINAAARLRPS